MKGDFTRNTFDPAKHYSRVLSQQGRVQLDADANEQAAILLHYLQTLAADLIGPSGGPADLLDASNKVLVKRYGFEIIADPKILDDLQKHLPDYDALVGKSKPPVLIGPGRYYVDGILCENEGYSAFGNQKDYLALPYPLDNFGAGSKPYLFYLDVWERHICAAEVEDPGSHSPSIREVALDGPDTATRAKVVWQVKAVALDKDFSLSVWADFLAQWQPQDRGLLKARALSQTPVDLSENCIIPPESQYRGAENQLYRVEIHTGTAKNTHPTFKWSRENGSVIFPIAEVESSGYVLSSLGRDARSGLEPGDWVEVIDDTVTDQNTIRDLLEVESVDPDASAVYFAQGAAVPTVDPSAHPYLRRWDQRGSDLAGGIPLSNNWIELEDGVQVQFHHTSSTIWRAGDFWLIPARTATGDVEWPGAPDDPEALPPQGVDHHFAPLGRLSVDGNNGFKVDDFRLAFRPLPEISKKVFP